MKEFYLSSWMYNPRDSLFAESVIKESGQLKKILKPIKYGFRNEFLHKNILSSKNCLFAQFN